MLGYTYGKLASISSMGSSDQDSNLRPPNHTAQTLTSSQSCDPKPNIGSMIFFIAYRWCVCVTIWLQTGLNASKEKPLCVTFIKSLFCAFNNLLLNKNKHFM